MNNIFLRSFFLCISQVRPFDVINFQKYSSLNTITMKQEFYYMPNGLTFKIHKNIAPNVQRVLGEDEKMILEILLIFFKERPNQLEKRLPWSGETDCSLCVLK